jgi:hypothetical protein
VQQTGPAAQAARRPGLLAASCDAAGAAGAGWHLAGSCLPLQQRCSRDWQPAPQLAFSTSSLASSSSGGGGGGGGGTAGGGAQAGPPASAAPGAAGTLQTSMDKLVDAAVELVEAGKVLEAVQVLQQGIEVLTPAFPSACVGCSARLRGGEGGGFACLVSCACRPRTATPSCPAPAALP